MIQLHRFNGSEFYLNCDEIHMVEALPDTTITTNTGEKFIVSESPEDIYRKIVQFRAQALGVASKFRDPEQVILPL